VSTEPLTPQQRLEKQAVIRSGAPYSVALAAARKICICMIAMLDADDIDEHELTAVCNTFAPALLRHEARQFVRMIREKLQH
jgi:hypothetical protein